MTSRTPRISVASLVYVPSRGLSAGAIAAIFFAVLLGVVVLVGGGYWLYQVLPSTLSSALLDVLSLPPKAMGLLSA